VSERPDSFLSAGTAPASPRGAAGFPSAISGGAVSYRGQPVLAPYHLTLRPARWTAILGPSGIGKSTLLKAIAGLLPGHAAPVARGLIAWMGQNDLLLPWLNVLDNTLLGARLRGEAMQVEKAMHLLDEAGLSAATAMMPAQLSGGMRQRVALVRTLMEDRPLVLMDEPFSALDPVHRTLLHRLSARLLRDRAVIFVTHDPQEALSLADEIQVLAGVPAALTLCASLADGLRPRDPLEPASLPLLRRIQAALHDAASPGLSS